jgi:carboxymethylenebutenolidase
MTTRTESITAADGQTFDGYTVLPASGHGPGVLVMQEIFGVNEYIRDVCRRLAELGYVAMAPDVYWRIERNVDIGHDPAEMAKAFGYMSKYDWPTGVRDHVAALAHLRALPETGAKAGAIGFCFGGGTSFALACAAQPDAVVSYYGSAVPGYLDQAGSVTSPICFHFGGQDPYIPRDEINAVRRWAAGRPGTEYHEYAAGHAFDNNFSAMFSDPPAAAMAWGHTVRFLATHLGAWHTAEETA